MCETHTHGPIAAATSVHQLGMLPGTAVSDSVSKVFSAGPTVRAFLPVDQQSTFVQLGSYEQIQMISGYITSHYAAEAGALYQSNQAAKANESFQEMNKKIALAKTEILGK